MTILTSKKERDHDNVIHKQNFCINGDFRIDQRNASLSSSKVTGINGTALIYLFDRWAQEDNHTTNTWEVWREAFTPGQTNVPGDPRYHLRHVVAGAPAGATTIKWSQKIEYVDAIIGKIGISFYAKADSAININIRPIQNFGTGGFPSPNVTLSPGQITLTTGWKEYKFEFQPPSILGKTLGTNNNDFIEIEFNLPVNTTFTFDLANVSFSFLYKIDA